MHELSLDEAVKNFAAVIQQVISGEEIVLTDRESPVAKIVSFHPAKVPARRFGCLKGLVRIGDDFDEPLEDFIDHPPIVYVLEDNEDISEILNMCLSFGGMSVHSFSTGEELLSRLRGRQELPDLISVDLRISGNTMQGKDVIRELLKEDISSEIAVLSANFADLEDSEDFLIICAASIVPKPFDNAELLKRYERLALIGRRRRMARERPDIPPDEDRLQRPVFLSAAEEDREFALLVRRNLEKEGIGVWYYPYDISLSAPWRHRIGSAIQSCPYFVCILSDNYAASIPCLAELTTFRSRLSSVNNQNLLLIPLIGDLSEDGWKQRDIKSVLSTTNGTKLRPRTIDAITVLTNRIRMALESVKPSSQSVTP